MKVIIVGARGQLGRCLEASAPPGTTIISHDIDTLNITDKYAVEKIVIAERPDILFNAAAYTAVDRAEYEEERAYAVNAKGVEILASAARSIKAHFVHVSTDFVFDGLSSRPYRPDAPADPKNAYGRTKLAGEILAGDDALIVRTAWVYAPSGGNFVRTMLRLLSERPEVRVVDDQIGTPTWAPGLAMALWKLGQKRVKGKYHFTDSGVASWYDFAVAIQEEALAVGILTHVVPIIPISSSEVQTNAQRPSYSVLDKSSAFRILGEIAPHWRRNLRELMRVIREEKQEMATTLDIK